jgi:hypothetical protein
MWSVFAKRQAQETIHVVGDAEEIGMGIRPRLVEG